MLTKEQFKKRIRYCSTIYASARRITLEDGYTLSVVNSGGLNKEQMDQILWEKYQERL